MKEWGGPSTSLESYKDLQEMYKTHRSFLVVQLAVNVCCERGDSSVELSSSWADYSKDGVSWAITHAGVGFRVVQLPESLELL